MTTRRSLLVAGLASLSTVAIGSRRAVADAPLKKVKAVIPQSSVFCLSYLGARDTGVYRKHGIDIEVDPRPFAGFLASLPSKQCMVTTYSGIDAIQKMNQGVDLVIIGGGLTVVQDVLVPKNSPIKTVADLRGKRFGTFSTGAGSFKAIRAAIIDGFKLDIVKDTNLKQVAGPALTKLLERGDIDAMINISSLNLAAEGQTDKFRVLFSPNDYWKQKTGFPIVWSAPLVAWRSWVDEDKARAENFAKATADAFRWLGDPKNLDDAVKKYGQLAGVTTPSDIAEYKKWLTEDRMFMTTWNRKAVDAQWKFLEVVKRTGVIDKVPDESNHALFVEG